MIKRVLVALSGSPYTPSVIHHGIELARAHDADITGVTITDLAKLANVGPVPLGGGAAASELSHQRIELAEERIRELSAQFQDTCARERIVCHLHQESGHIVDELIKLWRYNDIAVLGLRGLFEYGVIHNPDDMLIRIMKSGIRPILAVAKEHREIHKVLIAYNGSLEAAKAMKGFVQSRIFPEVTIRVVSFEKRKDDPQELLIDAQNYCAMHGFETDTDFVDADPRDELIDYAEQMKADLIVMGSTGRSRLASYVLGDTVHTAIKESHLPLYLSR
jgi:nucleotide-binding universal stress UspA family protein